MKVFIAGFGKLANAILSSDLSLDTCEMIKWESKWKATEEKAILIHAGSGRQLDECIDFCERTDSECRLTGNLTFSNFVKRWEPT